jgi:hypothetical protein
LVVVIVVKRRTATVIGIILVPTRPLECVILRTVHHAPFI